MTPDPLRELLSPPLGPLLAALWGALWGSFFNVAVGRLAAAAEEDESETWLGSARHALSSLRCLATPPSSCPRCRHPIRWHDNLPILGWVLLGGRCRDCRLPISPLYPLVELAGSLIALDIFHRFVIAEPAPPLLQLSRFLVYFFFVGALLVLTLIDVETTLLPLSITLPGIPAFFLAGRLLPDVDTVDALLGLGLGFGLLWLLRNGYFWLTGREGLGGGDEMLLGLIGGLLGWRALPPTLFLGAMSGLLVAVPALMVARARGRADGEGAAPEDDEGAPALRHVEVPFGPFLALGAVIYLFAGRWIWGLLVDQVTG